MDFNSKLLFSSEVYGRYYFSPKNNKSPPVVFCLLIPSQELHIVGLFIEKMASELNELQNATVGMTVGVIEVRCSQYLCRSCQPRCLLYRILE